jgi:hypothetical protein
MHKDEPTLLDHLVETRKKVFEEGGVTTIIFCGSMKTESDMAEVKNSLILEPINMSI